MEIRRELDFENLEDDRISDEPHVGLWKPGPAPSKVWPEECEPGKDWYVAINWFHSRGFMSGGEGGQINVMEERQFATYDEASALATEWGERLGLPVIEQGLELIWLPNEEQSEEQKARVAKIMETGKIEE